MSEPDKKFVKLISDLLVNAKGFCDYGIDRGLITEQDVRLTIAKRQEAAKALVNGGMSNRQAAKALGVHHSTVAADLEAAAENPPKTGGKSATPRKKPDVIHTLTDPIEPPCVGCEAEEQWQRSVQNNAGEAISLEAFWTRQFSGDWQKFVVTADMVALSKEAAKSWAAISKQLVNRLKQQDKGK